MEPKKNRSGGPNGEQLREPTKAEVLAQAMGVPRASLSRLYNNGKNLWPQEDSVDDFLEAARVVRGPR
ncbi:MAG: hypothetical protein SFY68_12200 [Candidatus Sumerlaeia bacterium]|nr:hypothetical protein [Candidatus Sumerlaeia bacterium]